MSLLQTIEAVRKCWMPTCLSVVCILFWCNGCRQQTSSPHRTPVRMAVGSQTELVYLASTLAQQLGYYEQEGVNVAITDTAGGSKALEALLGGSADVVTGFMTTLSRWRQKAGASNHLQRWCAIQVRSRSSPRKGPGKFIGSKI